MSGGNYKLSGGFIAGLSDQAGGCSPADVGSQCGVSGGDFILDNNDFIVFIEYFFTSDPRADLGVRGGGPGQDGAFDNNDFIAFIDLFFAGC